MPGGEDLMERSQRTNSSLAFLLCLCLFFSITSEPAHAGSIKTWHAEKLLQLGTNAEGSEALKLPSDVAVHKNRIYVVDGVNHRVVVYDLQGRLLTSFGSKGSEPGQFSYPVGIDAADDNRVYVADSGNHRIQIFSADGRFISSFKVAHKDRKGRPIDVMRHSQSGNLIISSSDHRIRSYTSKGRLLKTWGRNGTSTGEFRYPATLAELEDGRVAIVDVLNSRVQVFNTDGTLSLTVGQWGVLPGQLFRPKGIAIDSKGNFYISDSYMGVIQKYGDDGIFRAVMGDRGEPRRLTTPVGMSIDNNRLYVVEMRDNRISVYRLAN